MMANTKNGTVYLGSTVNLPKRVREHRNGVIEGFTRRYGCKRLVWYEATGSWEAARQRELQMKKWKRAWKLREIEGPNPDWDDLYNRIAYHERLSNWTPACAGVVRTDSA
jgi:putative endonuclease